MNTNQVLSLIRSIMLGVGASLVASGKLTDANLQEIVGGAMALGSVVWSQLHHSAPTAP